MNLSVLVAKGRYLVELKNSETWLKNFKTENIPSELRKITKRLKNFHNLSFLGQKSQNFLQKCRFFHKILDRGEGSL
jgi:hypothetical protein